MAKANQDNYKLYDFMELCGLRDFLLWRFIEVENMSKGYARRDKL